MTEHSPEEVSGSASARGPLMPVLPTSSRCCRSGVLATTDISEVKLPCSVQKPLADTNAFVFAVNYNCPGLDFNAGHVFFEH